MSMTLVTTRKKKTLICGPMTCTLVTREYLLMSETTKISRYSDGMLRTALNCSTLVALFAVFSALPATELWGAQSAIDRIEKIELALTGPTYVPQESQDLANKFVDQILPN